MANDQARGLSSRDFSADSFQHKVLGLREQCLAGQASPQQTDDWRKLADWLGCGDGPVTKVQADQVKGARIAFLRAASGSTFDAATLPPPDISDIFERLSPATIAIARLQAKGKGKEKVPALGIGRQFGSLVGGLIVFALIIVMALSRGAARPDGLAYLAGQAMFPAAVAAAVAAIWHGGAEFRPLKDSLILALAAGGLEGLTAASSVGSATGVLVGGLIFVTVALPTGILTALATWGLNRLVARLKAERNARQASAVTTD